MGFKSDEVVVDLAEKILVGYRKADKGIKDENIVNCHKVEQDIRWERPKKGLLKINTDVTIHSNKNFISFGIVIRNRNGLLFSKRYREFHSAVAEACAIFRCICFAVDAGLLPAVVESDSKTVVDLSTLMTLPRRILGLLYLTLFTM
ncbi:hypothetical protein QYF36_024173 [Acer negundo]|nr:hypothetical protein QYF36_024173 [Acer negundo]